MGEAFLLHEPGDDDSRFLVSVARPVEVPAAFQRMKDEDPVVGCPVGDDHVLAGIGLWSVLLEPVRDGEDDHLQGDRVLRAELRHRGLSEVGHLLGELLQRGDLLAEAPRHTDGLARFDQVLQRDAGDTLEFLPRPVAGQVEEHPHGGFRQGHVVPGGSYAHRLELTHHPPSDAPDILGWELLQDLLDVLRPVHVAAALQLGVFLAELRGNLREGLGRGDADGHRNGGLPPALPGNLLGVPVEVHVHPVQVQEGLVDTVDLDGRGVVPQDLLHPS